MNKVLGAVALHYGKEYFYASLSSFSDHVDEVVVFYTQTPSHGTLTPMKCPDKRDDLKRIADMFNCTWIDVSGVFAENRHRKLYEDYAVKNGFDQILIVDSDEIHVTDRIPSLLEEARRTGAKYVGVNGSNWLTPWRSFNEYVTDGFSPIRVINVKGSGGDFISEGFIYHMGYCISNALMEYKISCHGHISDFRRNHNWIKEKWHGYVKGETRYLHPATDDYWVETQELDKKTLPFVLKEHKNYNLKRVL